VTFKQLLTGSRASPLARAQFEEIQKEVPHLLLKPVWVETKGDLDQITSLRLLDKTDFFTYELDQMLLNGTIRLAIHSAKDLPDPLPEGLKIMALTKGLDPRDSLVLRFPDTLESLPSNAKIATSSLRREIAIKKLRSDLQFIDLRGDIHKRLSKLETKEADGVVIAEAALIRLNLTHLHRFILEGETAPLQGRLAVVARSDDFEMRGLFAAVFRT
jgi:hydroxymethylbilane synthase